MLSGIILEQAIRQNQGNDTILCTVQCLSSCELCRFIEQVFRSIYLYFKICQLIVTGEVNSGIGNKKLEKHG